MATNEDIKGLLNSIDRYNTKELDRLVASFKQTVRRSAIIKIRILPFLFFFL